MKSRGWTTESKNDFVQTFRESMGAPANATPGEIDFAARRGISAQDAKNFYAEYNRVSRGGMTPQKDAAFTESYKHKRHAQGTHSTRDRDTQFLRQNQPIFDQAVGMTIARKKPPINFPQRSAIRESGVLVILIHTVCPWRPDSQNGVIIYTNSTLGGLRMNTIRMLMVYQTAWHR